jgi:hypothetical protein
MKTKYETPDGCLDALDAVTEKVAEQTRGMTAEQVKAYFARATRALHQATGQEVRIRRASPRGPLQLVCCEPAAPARAALAGAAGSDNPTDQLQRTTSP